MKTLQEKAEVAISQAQRRIPEFAERIAPLFAHNEWAWYDGVPNAEKIDFTLRELCSLVLSDVSKDSFDGNTCWNTGRLQVRTFVRREGEIACIMELVPESLEP